MSAENVRDERGGDRGSAEKKEGRNLGQLFVV